MFSFSGLLFLLVIAFQVFCFYRIMGKAGYNPLWGLVGVIPIGSLVLIGVLAFADWPSDRG
ncbi:MAG: hypothetical protein AAF922_07240 [Pseudomonadota bacterium]